MQIDIEWMRSPVVGSSLFLMFHAMYSKFDVTIIVHGAGYLESYCKSFVCV